MKLPIISLSDQCCGKQQSHIMHVRCRYCVMFRCFFGFAFHFFPVLSFSLFQMFDVVCPNVSSVCVCILCAHTRCILRQKCVRDPCRMKTDRFFEQGRHTVANQPTNLVFNKQALEHASAVPCCCCCCCCKKMIWLFL